MCVLNFLNPPPPSASPPSRPHRRRRPHSPPRPSPPPPSPPPPWPPPSPPPPLPRAALTAAALATRRPRRRLPRRCRRCRRRRRRRRWAPELMAPQLMASLRRIIPSRSRVRSLARCELDHFTCTLPPWRVESSVLKHPRIPPNNLIRSRLKPHHPARMFSPPAPTNTQSCKFSLAGRCPAPRWGCRPRPRRAKHPLLRFPRTNAPI